MLNPIQTPISLWKDFDDSTPLNATVISTREEDGILYKETCLMGRATELGRVSIYGTEVRPVANGNMPALLLLPIAGVEPDLGFAARLAKRGISVFCMDYAGEDGNNIENDEQTLTSKRAHTIYPSDIDYANYVNCKKKLDQCVKGAKKTAWYEWTAVARAALRYVRSLSYVSCVGALGIREGGEILWKLMSFGGLDCAICVNSVGWLAYRGKNKFGQSVELTEEERLFVAGIDSQSYAPFAKCPVLMLVSINDPFVDAERAYDTFKRINEKQFSTIDYSLDYGSLIDGRDLVNIGLFLDKYLKHREIFLPDPLKIETQEQANYFKVTISPDELGVAEKSAIYYFESGDYGEEAEWIRTSDFKDEDQNKFTTLALYEKTKRVHVFGKVRFSNGFTVSSRIAVKDLEYTHHNGIRHTNILFDSLKDTAEVFYPLKSMQEFSKLGNMLNPEQKPTMSEGYGKIKGVSCSLGLKTGRISRSRYAPQERSLLHFDVYCPQGGVLEVGVTKAEADGTDVLYLATVYAKSIKTWQAFMIEPNSFRADGHRGLNTFVGCKTIQFSVKEDGDREQLESKKFLLNNLIWI